MTPPGHPVEGVPAGQLTWLHLEGGLGDALLVFELRLGRPRSSWNAAEWRYVARRIAQSYDVLKRFLTADPVSRVSNPDLTPALQLTLGGLELHPIRRRPGRPRKLTSPQSNN